MRGKDVCHWTFTVQWFFYCPQTERTEKHDRIKTHLQRFQKMNDFKIRLEYARVLNDIAFLEKFLVLNQLTEKEYFAHIEPLDNAKSFLEGYLARSVLASKGFTTEDGITWEYYRGDRNLLSPRKSEKLKSAGVSPQRATTAS